MPRYYFDLRDGIAFVRDDEGMDLSDTATAQIEAAENLVDMTKDLAMNGTDRSGRAVFIEVRDSEGPLFLLGFVFAKRHIDG